MPLFEHLRLEDGEQFNLEMWGDLMDSLENLALTIPDNSNGEIINEVAIGTKPGDGSEMNYPWVYETIGVSNKTRNLRFQSPNSVFIHTNIDGNEAANKTKVPLAIMKDGKIGIGTSTPKETLDVNGLIKTNKGIKFKDNSIQTRASTVNMINSGSVSMNKTGKWQTSPLATGKTYTSPTIPLSGFTKKPVIMHSITYFDSSKSANTRMSISPINVTKNGFKIKFYTWADSKIYNCVVNWVALGT